MSQNLYLKIWYHSKTTHTSHSYQEDIIKIPMERN